MFLSRSKKNIATFWLKKAPYQELWVSSGDVYGWTADSLGKGQRSRGVKFTLFQDIVKMHLSNHTE